MAIVKLVNEFLKLYSGSIPKKEYIIDKSAVKILKYLFFFKFSRENVRIIWCTYCFQTTSYFLQIVNSIEYEIVQC